MKFDLLNIKNKLLVKYPFFGTVIANVKFGIDNSMPTAYTDGTDIYYNEEFMNKLSEPEQIFILAHEVCHIAFDHINRSKDKDGEVWNIVTDAVINAFLHEDGLPIFEGGIDIPWASDYNAEELYDVFLKNKQLLDKIKQMLRDMIKKNNKNKSNQNNQPSTSFGHDSHDNWNKKKNNTPNQSNQNNNEDKDEERRKKRIANEQEAMGNDGEKKSFKKNREEKKDRLQKMKEEIENREISTQAGNNDASYIRKLTEIGVSKGLIDWRYLLRESITYDLDWSYKNATIEDGILRANLEEIPYSEVEIVLDTSGSIDEELLKTFLRECKNIMFNAKVKVGCFDTKFYGFKTIRSEKDINEMEFAGGGGTDFTVASSAFTRRVINKIIFTDGYAEMPDDPPSIIWVVIGNHRIEPKNGKVIYINRNDLMKKKRR